MGVMRDPELPPTSRRVYYLDLLERVAWTFAQGFCAFWIITGDIDGTTLLGGLVAGAGSVAKGVAAKAIGSSNSAATLPQPPDYTAAD